MDTMAHHRTLMALALVLCVLSAATAFRFDAQVIHRKEKEACSTKPDLPPTFEDDVYYASALDVEDDPRALRTALNEILSKSVRHSYSCVWDMLEDADSDPTNSSNVILIYTGESYPKADRDNGSGVTGWNREHVWPKSHGFPNEGQWAYTDAHHLRACEKQANNRRSDKDFASGGNAYCLLPFGNPMSDCDAISYETSTSLEPPAGSRGNVARMIFYMEVRYAGQDTDKTGVPALTIVNNSTYRMSEPLLGFLCDLYDWHLEEPVSDLEVRRNDRVYEWQHNRNPFIDHPEWIKTLWGDECDYKRSLQNRY